MTNETEMKPVDIGGRMRELIEYRAKLQSEIIAADARIDELQRLFSGAQQVQGGEDDGQA